MGRNLSLAPDCSLGLQGDQPNRSLFSNLCAVGIGLAELSGIWKEHDWKINDKERGGEEVCG